MLLSTVFKRTRKLGDRSAFAAADALDEAAAGADEEEEAVVAAAAASATAGLAAAAAAGPSDAAVDDDAAALACLSALLVAALDAIGILRERTHPSRRPQRPPAPSPTATCELVIAAYEGSSALPAR